MRPFHCSRLLCLLPLLAALTLGGCGYFTNHWPTLKQDPIPKTAAEAKDNGDQSGPPEKPSAPGEEPPEGDKDAAGRLKDYQDRFKTLSATAHDQLEAINPAPKTPDDWGLAQLTASRLLRTENALRSLRDDAMADETAAPEAEAAGYASLAKDIAALLARLTPQRLALERQLATHIPEETPPAQPAPKPSEPAVPEGRAALTITAEADEAAYSQALNTLVEKAQAINANSVYHIVASPGSIAAERVKNIRSLLAAAGIKEANIKATTDPAAPVGSLRIYVNEP